MASLMKQQTALSAAHRGPGTSLCQPSMLWCSFVRNLDSVTHLAAQAACSMASRRGSCEDGKTLGRTAQGLTGLTQRTEDHGRCHVAETEVRRHRKALKTLREPGWNKTIEPKASRAQDRRRMKPASVRTGPSTPLSTLKRAKPPTGRKNPAAHAILPARGHNPNHDHAKWRLACKTLRGWRMPDLILATSDSILHKMAPSEQSELPLRCTPPCCSEPILPKARQHVVEASPRERG